MLPRICPWVLCGLILLGLTAQTPTPNPYTLHIPNPVIDGAPHYPTPVYASNLLVQGLHNGKWTFCLSFMNVGTGEDITALQFQWRFFDAFDTVLYTANQQITGTFAQNVLQRGPSYIPVDGSFDSPVNIFGGDPSFCGTFWTALNGVAEVTVTIAKVRYADGTIWVNAHTDYPLASVQMTAKR